MTRDKKPFQTFMFWLPALSFWGSIVSFRFPIGWDRQVFWPLMIFWPRLLPLLVYQFTNQSHEALAGKELEKERKQRIKRVKQRKPWGSIGLHPGCKITANLKVFYIWDSRLPFSKSLARHPGSVTKHLASWGRQTSWNIALQIREAPNET